MLSGGVALLDNKVRVSSEDGHLLTEHVARSRLQGNFSCHVNIYLQITDAYLAFCRNIVSLHVMI